MVRFRAISPDVADDLDDLGRATEHLEDLVPQDLPNCRMLGVVPDAIVSTAREAWRPGSHRPGGGMLTLRRVILEIESDRDPIHGVIRPPSGDALSFHGWLDLAAAIEAVRQRGEFGGTPEEPMDGEARPQV